MSALQIVSGKKLRPATVKANGEVTVSHLGLGMIMSVEDRYVAMDPITTL
jgi:hypothetical protein